MILGMDISPAVYHRGGIGVYTQALYSALQELPEHLTILPAFNRTGAKTDLSWLHNTPVTLPWGNKAWRLRTMLAHLIRRSQDHLFPEMDVFLAPDHLLPNFATMKTAFVVHDISFRLTHTVSSWNKLFLSTMLPRFLKKATTIVTPSQSTCQDLLRLYGVSPNRVHVIPHGVDPVFQPGSSKVCSDIRERYNLPEQFILTVGTIEPRKNYIRLLHAYAALGKSITNIPLVIVGRRGWRSQLFYSTREKLDCPGEVRLLNYVPFADLPALYSAATLFVYPSLYEGFGLPTLEAMACGTPVISSNRASLPEVVGDAGILIPPEDIQSLSNGMHELLNNPAQREELRARGLARAEQFTWQHTAKTTYAVLQSCLETVKR